MTYKTILVHLADEHRVPSLLQTAASIARDEGAHLIGLSVIPPTIIVAGTEGAGDVVIEDHRVRYMEQSARMRQAMLTVANEVPGLAHSWREVDCEAENPFGIAASVIVAQSRCADLVVASQANRSWALSGHLDVVDELVMESGRPVLMVPKAGVRSRAIKRAVVAWNGRREAARAAFDALPLLARAERVCVVWVDPESEQHAAGDLPGIDLCEALSRHGIKCEAAPAAGKDGTAGAALLAAADRHDADLLVMGCYGHSRLREMILGGASRHVLQHARIPVLLSH